MTGKRMALTVWAWLVANVTFLGAQGNPATPLPPEVVAAWKKAGAYSGWAGVNALGYLQFGVSGKSMSGFVPAFQFKQWKPRLMVDLPAPEQEFGLELANSQMTDDGMRELSRFKHLHSLKLGYTNVTDAGLQHLAGLDKLQIVDLRSTKLSDAGAKELARHPKLQFLLLSETKELPGLKVMR